MLKFIKRRKRKQFNLTTADFFCANQPGYLTAFPEIKQRLIEYQKENKPGDCTRCFFLGHRDSEEGIEFFCPLGEITFDYEKRAKECILDKE